MRQTNASFGLILARANRGEEKKREKKRKKRKKKREKSKKVCFDIGIMCNLGFWYDL